MTDGDVLDAAAGCVGVTNGKASRCRDTRLKDAKGMLHGPRPLHGLATSLYGDEETQNDQRAVNLDSRPQLSRMPERP